MSRIIIVPGLDNSGPDHWQSALEARLSRTSRIALENWREPDLKGWSTAILALLTPRAPALLVAHSFGCLASIRAAQQRPEAVSGLLLVAPADPGKFGFDPASFERPLRQRSVLVGSDNDPWMSARRARTLAEALGADFINLGLAGHINAMSGYGPWPGGLKLVEGLRRPRVRGFREAVQPPAP